MQFQAEAQRIARPGTDGGRRSARGANSQWRVGRSDGTDYGLDGTRRCIGERRAATQGREFRKQAREAVGRSPAGGSPRPPTTSPWRPLRPALRFSSAKVVFAPGGNGVLMIPNINSIDVLRYHRSSMGPTWRVQLASSRPTRSFRRMNGLRDPTVRALQDYFGLTAKKGWAAARAEFPLIARAEDLEQDASRRGSARLMILAGAASEEMSERLGVSVPVIQVWESLYFDVRDLQHALAWVSTYVIRPEQEAGHAELAARLKVAATAGPEAARALLDGPPEVPGDEAERLAWRHLSLQTKLEEAVEMPVETNREKFQFVKYYGRLLITRKRLELASARLAEKRAAARTGDATTGAYAAGGAIRPGPSDRPRPAPGRRGSRRPRKSRIGQGSPTGVP
jgi:hypothetical protein